MSFNSKDYFQLGTIIRSHGIKGDLVIYLDADNPSSYKKLEAVFLKEDGQLKEWKVASVRVQGQLATVHFNGIEDRNTSDLMIKREVFLPLKQLNPLKEKQFYFHEVIGFQITDMKAGALGEVTQVYELPQHPVLAIHYQNKEILIPAVPEFILHVDREKKIIEMDLPDGLLDIYIA